MTRADEKRTERIFIRVSPDEKEQVLRLARVCYGGNLSEMARDRLRVRSSTTTEKSQGK